MELNNNAALNEISSDIKKSGWLDTVGNSLALTYFESAEPDNPSGKRNIKAISYKNDGIVVRKRTIKYNLYNEIIEITVTNE